MREQSRLAKIVSVLRCAVGGVLIARPGLAAGGEPERRLLVRTIGLRDLVLGAATLAAVTGDIPPSTLRRRWLAAGLANDAGDILLALAARRGLGTRATLIAALTPVPFVAAGVRTLVGGRA